MIKKIEVGDIVNTQSIDDYRIFYRISEDELMTFMYQEATEELLIERKKKNSYDLLDPKSIFYYCVSASKEDLISYLMSEGRRV